MIIKTLERDNVRFVVSHTPARAAYTTGSGTEIPATHELWVFDATRISDGHRLAGQQRFAEDPSEFIEEGADIWFKNHPGLSSEPPAVCCTACNKVLTSDYDTEFAFDNVLWVGFFGGYGMFVDQMTTLPINTADRWLRDEDGEYLTVLEDQGRLAHVDDPDYEPEYEQERVLPGRPDHEAVICHTCAHSLCEQIPWLGKLINPHGSHAHRSKEIPKLLLEGHSGWDLDGERGELV